MGRLRRIFLSFALIITLIPSGALAGTTWGDGNTEDESASEVIVNYEGTDRKNPKKLNWIQYKKGTYDKTRFTFNNIDDELNLDPDVGLTGDHKLKVVSNQLESWCKIAPKVFKSGATTGGYSNSTHTYGVTSNTLLHDWGYYFEYTGSDGRQHGRINLADWFLKLDESKRDHYSAWPADWTWKTTGVKTATSLSDVRDDMIKTAASEYGFSADAIYKQRSNGENKNGALSQINDSKVRGDGVYYTIVCHHTDEALLGETAFNCYAVILYDLRTQSLGGDGLYYPLQKENYTESPSTDPKVIAMKNEGEFSDEGSITYTSGTEETSSYQHQYSHTINPGIGAEGQIGFNTSKLLPIAITGSFTLNGHFDYTYQDTGVDTKGKTEDNTESASLSGTLAPHTGKNYSNYKATQANTANYMDPSFLSYKVAMCSISGTKYGGSSTIYNGTDFCTFFAPTALEDSGFDAITNLNTRKLARLGEAYGKTEGYVGNSLKMEQLDWDSKYLSSESISIGGKSETIDNIIKDRAGSIPFISKGLVLNINNANYLLSSGKTMPLYPLTTVKVADKLLNLDYKGYSNDSTTIHLVKGDTYSLDNVDVEGYDGGKAEDGSEVNPMKFHGFDPSAGSWSVSSRDKDGNLLEQVGAIDIETDPNTGGQILKVTADEIKPEEPKTGYIEWHMNDDRRYETLTGKNTTDYNLENRPYIKVVCHSEFEGYSIGFQDPNNPAEGCALEDLPLSTLLPANVYDKDGNLRSNNVEYKIKGFGETVFDHEAEIVNKTFLRVKKDINEDDPTDDEGNRYREYEIYAQYGDKTSLNDEGGVAKIRIYPSRKLTLPPYNETRIVNPSMEKHNLATMFNLSVHLDDYKDQYGEPWKGTVPEWDLKITEGDESAVIKDVTVGKKDITVLIVRKPGDYKVTVIPKGGSADDAITTFTYKVKVNPLQAATPSSKVGLVYNGNEQTAVERGEGYDVLDGSATDAGEYTATAILKDGFAWADGHLQRERPIPYNIAPQSVDVPEAADNLVYNGKDQIGVIPGEGYTLTDNFRSKDAGTYEVIATPDKNYVWPDGSAQSIPITYTISKASVDMPEAVTSFDYDGKSHTALPAGQGYTVTGGVATNAGFYTATASLSDKENYQWTNGDTEDLTYDYIIRKAKILDPISVTSFTYDGTHHVALAEGDGYTVTDGAAVNAGNYTAVATLDDKSNYEWIGGGTRDIIVDYKISKAVITAPAADTQFIYDGKRQTAVPGGNGYSVINGQAKNAGDYTATASLDDKANYQWSTGGSKDLSINYTIDKAGVAFPKTNVELIYNGKMQTAVPGGNGYNVLNGQAKNAGEYAATVELNDSANYKWNNGGSAKQQVIYSIEKAKVTVPKVRSGLVYNGKKQTGVAASDGCLVTKGTATKAGSYTATAKLKDSENYAWSTGGDLDLSLNYTIAKTKNTMTAKGKTISVKYKKLKKKNLSFSRSKAVAVKKSVGKLSYKKVSGNKKITINKKSGKVTVKKKLKKGTYKIKMKVKAAGNSNYKALTKTVTFKVKVK